MRNRFEDNRFEDMVSRSLDNVPEPRDSEIEALRQFAEALPRREAPRMRNMTYAGVAAILVLVVGLTVRQFLFFGTSSVGGQDHLVDTLDPRYGRCYGDQQTVLAAFAMDHAADFTTHFPHADPLHLPEVDQPAFVVVFAEKWSGGDLPGRPVGSPTSLAYTDTQHDVCVWVGSADSGEAYLFARVNTADFAP
jgi:hypothetical protein